MSTKAYFGFFPWIVFAVVDRSTGLGLERAGVFAAICGGIALVIAVRSRELRVLDPGSVVLFGAISITAYLVHAGPGSAFDDYARSISVAGLAGLLFVSLLFVPAAEQYTRDAVPSRFRHDPGFAQVNRALTREMGCAAVCITACFVIGGALRGPVPATLFNWIVPIGILALSVSRITARWLSYQDGKTALAVPLDSSMSPFVSLEEASFVAREGPGRAASLRLVTSTSVETAVEPKDE
jgi:hypothetical protein